MAESATARSTFAVLLCTSRNSGIAASGGAREKTAASGRRHCKQGRLTANHFLANVLFRCDR
jgi:hypothetical protein